MTDFVGRPPRTSIPGHGGCRLAVEQLMKFELIINLEDRQALDLIATVLARADED
jgi:hypothetical protein